MSKNIRYCILSTMIVAALLACFSWTELSQHATNKTITITVDLAAPVRSGKSMVGFLLSFNDKAPAQNLIDEVAPKTWRVGHGLSPKARFSNMKHVRNNVLTPIALISDFYRYPGEGSRTWIPPNVSPKEYLHVVDTIYNRYGNNVIYDLWNEPNGTMYWRGGENGFFATFKLAHDRIRSLPGGDKALISGPSINKFDKGYIERFLTFCVYNNIKLDVLSWHDFRTGDDLLQLKNDLKWAQNNWVKKYPSLGIKKIQLNEIIAQKDQYSPLVPLMYFKALEDGGADASCKACWPNSKGVSNCNNNSLDGLVNEKGEPRAVWWAYKYYNESTKHRLASMSSSESLVPFAYQAPENNKEVRILLANYKNDLSFVNINLKQLKYMAAFKDKKDLTIQYYQIPDTEESSLKEPLLIDTKKINIANLSTASISFNNLKMNEVYLLKIK